LAGYGREQGNGGTPLGSSRQGLLGAVRVRTRRLFSFLPAASLIHLRGISASAPQGDIRGRPFSPHQGNSAKSDVARKNIRFAPKSRIPEGRIGSKPDSALDAALLVGGEMPKLQIWFHGGLPVRAQWRIGKL